MAGKYHTETADCSLNLFLCVVRSILLHDLGTIGTLLEYYSSIVAVRTLYTLCVELRSEEGFGWLVWLAFVEVLFASLGGHGYSSSSQSQEATEYLRGAW